MDSFHTAIYENLRLLTKVFPNMDMETKLQEGMFKRPNTQGMQSVFYSLMTILNPEYCRKNIPWPVSFQSDNYKFRTSVINFIKTECPDFEAPQLLPSLLNKAEGEKYVRLLFDFVTYVTKIMIQRRNFAVLNLPSAAVDEDESASVFLAVTSSNIEKMETEGQSSMKHHEKFMKNSLRSVSESEREKKAQLRDINEKREKLFRELPNVLSNTEINEKNIVESVLSDYQTEAYESRRNYSFVRQDVCRILTKTEYLVRMINLQQNHAGDLISSEFLRSQITSDLENKINVPITTILSTLFAQTEGGTLINLKEFVRYGYLLLKSRQQRFLSAQKSYQNQVIHHEVDDILSSVTQKAEELENLREELEKIILDCEQNISVLKSRCEEDTNLDENLVETMRMVLSLKKYYPKLTNQHSEESVLLDRPRALESNEEVVAKLQKLMKRDP